MFNYGLFYDSDSSDEENVTSMKIVRRNIREKSNILDLPNAKYAD